MLESFSSDGALSEDADVDPEPLTLEGRFVRLEPLTLDHAQAFLSAGAEWGFTADFVQTSIAATLRKRDDGTAIPFATVDKASGQVAGGTAFLRIDANNRRLEIGSTWLGRPWRRTAVNTEAKFLMLTHAFEVMNCVRVEFRADAQNERSRTALLRLGAVEEGTLRNFRLENDGRAVDIVVYSVIESEWPAVKVRIRTLMDRPPGKVKADEAPAHASSS